MTVLSANMAEKPHDIAFDLQDSFQTVQGIAMIAVGNPSDGDPSGRRRKERPDQGPNPGLPLFMKGVWSRNVYL